MTPTSAAITAGAPNLKLTFDYDYRGRRIRKWVQSWNGTAYATTSDLRFFYDGWNLEAELDGMNNKALLRSYQWGLDLSGSLTGAGGVGGLLWMKSAGGNPQFAAYDGNGNVVGLVDGSNGTLSADYEYGPFGELIRMTGTQAVTNVFRFSTKYQDAESGLIYYGYRYYNPTTGRWLSRDPIQEGGGLDIFESMINNPLNYIDLLGLAMGNPVTGPGGELIGPADSFLPPGIYRLGVYIDGSYYTQAPNGWYTPILYGALWLRGWAPDYKHFGPDDEWTQAMSASYVMLNDRNKMRRQLRRYCDAPNSTTLQSINFGSELADIPKSQYVLSLFPSELKNNPVAAFTGSWTRGTMNIMGVDCCNRKAWIHVHAENDTGLSSLSHEPRKYGVYGASVLSNNLFGSEGYMHTTVQGYDWDETIYF